MRRTGFALIAALALAFATGVAERSAAAQTYVYYEGGHPIPEAFGGGFCYEEGPHYHAYAPADLDFYVVYDGYYHFVGDPWFYGYSGALYWYYDPHPIWVGGYADVCYITGPHRHWYRPYVGFAAGYYHDHGYYYYRGDWPRGVRYMPARRIALERRFPQRYAEHRRMAPRTPPPVTRPPAAGARYDGSGTAGSRSPMASRGRGAPPPANNRAPAARGQQYGGSGGRPAPATDAPRYGNTGGRPAPATDAPRRPDRSAPPTERPAASGGKPAPGATYAPARRPSSGALYPSAPTKPQGETRAPAAPSSRQTPSAGRAGFYRTNYEPIRRTPSFSAPSRPSVSPGHQYRPSTPSVSRPSAPMAPSRGSFRPRHR